MSRHLKIPSLLWSAVGLAMVTISKRLQSSFWEVQMKRNENGSYSPALAPPLLELELSST
uniref:Uncharacterized protein n=1 Tax=Oryza sativa subsp. japonica TaxID=39947 RepID=Q2QQP4_ORYSJ|nr:hypothetical protein LOC_Os12g30330 [Oryza sativa Japonica Group]